MTDKAASAQNTTHQGVSETAAPKIAIIGGGLTGLFTATLLERALSKSADSIDSMQITIFEKSRSVGRLATRYRADKQSRPDSNISNDIHKQWQWAFGAQFFTAKSDSFSAFIKPWLDTGLLEPWCAHVVNLTPANGNTQGTGVVQAPAIEYKEQWDTTHARYISTPKMTSWGRALADNLRHTRMCFKTRVMPLQQPSVHQTVGTQTELFDENGVSLGWFDWVVCTAPNVQAHELLAGSGFSKQAKIMQPKMLACYTLMLGWDSIESLPESLKHQTTPVWDVAYLQGSILDRAFIEHQKPARDNLLPSITIHASNDWSEQHVDEDIEAIKAQLLAAAKQALNWDEDTAPSQVDCHRWRYASTVLEDKKDTLGILVDKTQQWIVSGDWCGQGNIESCYQAATEVVEVIVEAVVE